ncbi:XkdX family protein [Clostridium sp. JS66]|nr:XkdX family protein [Clostridium sp. JS66]WPC41208.1 XkdX family protein [Clostridium sp. JS66]
MLGYDFYYIGYVCGYLSLSNIKQGVVNGDVSKDQFKEITGVDYTE